MVTAHLPALLRHDMRLQKRNGIYYAYAFVLALYIVVLLLAGSLAPSWAVALAIYGDPAALGFFFLGALVMLEKAEGARIALAITPLRASDYFWSKTITLTVVALIATIVIGLVAKTVNNWPIYLAVTALTSITFIGIGMPIALRFKTVSSYLVGSAGLFLPLMTPIVLAFIDPFPLWLALVPTTAQFRLLLIAVDTFDAGLVEILALFAVVTLTTILSVCLAIWFLKKEFADR